MVLTDDMVVLGRQGAGCKGGGVWSWDACQTATLGSDEGVCDVELQEGGCVEA